MNEQQIAEAKKACEIFYFKRYGWRDMYRQCTPAEQNAWHAVVKAVKGVEGTIEADIVD